MKMVPNMWVLNELNKIKALKKKQFCDFAKRSRQYQDMPRWIPQYQKQ